MRAEQSVQRGHLLGLGQWLSKIQFSPVQSLSRVRLWDPMNRSAPGLPVHHHLPIHEYRMPLHLFRSFLNSCRQCCVISSVNKSYTSFVKFVPKHFILLVVIVNGMVFWISFSDSSLLVYKITIDFCKSILYPVTSMNSFIISSHFFW